MKTGIYRKEFGRKRILSDANENLLGFFLPSFNRRTSNAMNQMNNS